MTPIPRIAALLLCLGTAAVVVEGQNPATPAQQRPQTTGTAFLAGQVIDEASGRPVPDAVVRIAIANNSLSGNLMFANMPNRAAVATDSQGRYFFGSLPAGAYAPRATKPGYATSVGTARAIALADGDHIVDLNIRLSPLGTISGTLRDDAGDPVVGADVIAFRRTLANGRPFLRSSGQATSDDRGQYRVTALPAGDYVVCACARRAMPFDGTLLTTLAADTTQLLGVASRAISVGADVAQLDNTMRTFAPTFYPSSVTVAGSTRVALGAGDDKTGVDFELTPTVSTRVSGTVSGGVSPMFAPEVRLLPAGESDESSGLTQLAPMLLQADGRFDFVGVPPGQYVMRVAHMVTGARSGGPSGEAMALLGPRGSPPSMIPVPIPGGETYWTSASTPITVTADGARGVVVALRAGVPIKGRLQFVGAVPQPTAQDLSRVNVLLQSLTPGALQNAVGINRVNGDGTFQLPSVLPGRYFFNTSLIANWTTLKSITLRDQDVTDLPLDVGDVDPGELVITFGDAPTATLAGQPSTVVGATRRAEDVTALIFPTETRFWTDPGAALRRFRSAPVTREGSFTPIPLAAGEYFVAVVPDARAVDWQERSQFEALAKTAQRVRIADGEHKVVEIR